VISTGLGIIVFATACFIYLRYASHPPNLHVQEQIQHAATLEVLWKASFYGSAILLVLSIFGLGWARWVGLTVNAGAFLYALMTLGAMCGPFGC
jgi:hypothetical protein